MTDVVDSDELLRRLQRARACAQQEQLTWQSRSEEFGAGSPDPAHAAAVRTLAYEVVVRVLDEVLTPGKRAARTGTTE
ncbi:hypothetical protein [Streptomyces cylindrosporus]|uniref:Uncharacterized protein n=1 Tax=Streptomyces cylindrosporus TaxID=2927583 RepID=A0ABS9Y991_9ACTN|nr:hypothetical protein [Streptomyces cylindrosporus]MCI3273787.1 hypothetical protein [Streptomyces cylindrosporus]